MWQAISTLLRDWHTEDAEIELKTELPGGDPFRGIYASAERLLREMRRTGTSAYLHRRVRSLELLSRSKTVRVPQVFAVGMRAYSFHASMRSGAISRSSVWILITIFPPRRSPTPAASLVGFCRAAYRLAAGARGGEDCTLAISIP